MADTSFGVLLNREPSRAEELEDLAMAKRLTQQKDEETSARVAEIASRGLTAPGSLTLEEIRALCGSVLTQRPDRTKG